MTSNCVQPLRTVLSALALALTLTSCGNSSSTGNSEDLSAQVRDGHARFTVLTPMLIRLEYADDDRFEDRTTQTVPTRDVPVPAFTTAVEDGKRVIRTGALTLRYQQESGPFTPQNLSIELHKAGETVTVQPDWTPGAQAANSIGGWRRSLDNEQDPQPLHEGLLSRSGWSLLDDTRTVIMPGSSSAFEARPARSGAYQDGYFFGYGLDYAQALSDLRALTGPAPLLPRKAFGVWFSRYWAYSDAELRELVAQFREHGVPLDTLSLDTDWKRMHNAAGCAVFSVVAGARLGDPCSWNGWDWNYERYPDPAGFVAWAHDQGIEIGLNVHPSINTRDPQYAMVREQTGGLTLDLSVPPCTLLQADPLGQCMVFDWINPQHLESYFALHAPMEAIGADFWWLDWCCDGSKAEAPGLTADTFINEQYARRNAARGIRWPAFSRIGASFQAGDAGVGNNDNLGAFAEHRHTLHFTGDTCGTWQMLAFEAEFTAAEGAIGMPYVSHDIGSFLGPPTATGCNGTLGHTSHLPDDMYVRWLQFGTFQPIDRLHSSHGDRLPWEYPGAAESAATQFLRLRGRLVPYLYNLARESHDSGLPMARALYLQWPEIEEAYQHPTQYTLGRDMLITPVTAEGNPATVEVWFPPGRWIDYFTGESFIGPVSASRSVPYERYPVFMRAGAILPTQPDLPASSAGPQDELTLTAWAGGDGRFELYEDAGEGFSYRDGHHSRTAIATTTSETGCVRLDIGAATGSFAGALTQRRWTLQLAAMDEPQTVLLAGQSVDNWSYDAAKRILTIPTGARPAAAALSLVAGPDGCH
jgi:hypothetical protein